MLLQSGVLLQGGKYRIESTLGQGGFGITYLAQQIGLNRKVAIKEFFIKKYCNRDAQTHKLTVGSESNVEELELFQKKFIKEAQMIASFDHPHIIRIHDIFEENNTAYYVMEYISGGSLEDYANQNGALSETEALHYIQEIADALDYIHKRQINHLDVKPGNILRRIDTHLQLIDFGLAKHYDEQGKMTSTTPVGISFGYAPLEQYKQGGISTFTPTSDIYSLGAVLYKLLTGEKPVDAEDIFNNGFPELPANITFNVREAVRKAMEPKKKDRPQSITEFLELLQNKKCDEADIEETIIYQKSNLIATDQLQREIINGLQVKWNISNYNDPQKQSDIKYIITRVVNRLKINNEHTFFISSEPLWDEIRATLYNESHIINRECSFIPVELIITAMGVSKLLNTLQQYTGIPFRLPYLHEWQQASFSPSVYPCLIYDPYTNLFRSDKGEIIRTQDMLHSDSGYCVYLACDAHPTGFDCQNDKYALIDQTGNILSSYKYNHVGLWQYGFAKVWIGEKVGMVNQEGKEVIPVSYDSLEDVNPFTYVPMGGPVLPERFLGTEYRKGNMRGCFEVEGWFEMKLHTHITNAEWEKRAMFT